MSSSALLSGLVANIVPLQVIGYGIVTALITELVGYILIYRTASFKRLKNEFESYEPSKADTGAQETAKGSSSTQKKKKDAKLKNFEADAGKKMAVVQIVTGILTMVTMISSVKIIPQIFGNEPAGVLPFEPPGFIKKITQRGLDADAIMTGKEFSPFFIFMLCQGSVKVLVGKIMGLGPSRKMQMFKPDVSKAFKTE